MMNTISKKYKYKNSYGLKCYDIVEDTVTKTYLPNTNNSVSESKKWMAAQPGHLRWNALSCGATMFTTLDDNR